MTLDTNHPNKQNGIPAIRIVDLCRHYQMGETLIRAVDGVSLGVQRGEFVALLGSSGSGKSSLLNLIAGLDRPTSGAVIVEDHDLARLSREELAKHRLRTVGMVFQSFNLVSRMTLAENVDLPLRFAEMDRGQRQTLTRQALERVGLGSRMTHRPSELSGGEQQRAALARALINQPKLLLADELSLGLAPLVVDRLLEGVREAANRGVAVLLVLGELAAGDDLLGDRQPLRVAGIGRVVINAAVGIGGESACRCCEENRDGEARGEGEHLSLL